MGFLAINQGSDAGTRQGAETRCRRHPCSLGERFGHYSLGQRVLALCLQGVSLFKELCSAHTHGRDYICNPRFAACYGASFIQCYNLHLTGCFQGLAGLEQDAMPGSYAVSHHYGYRGSQSQGAGAGDNQYRYSARKRKAPCFSCQYPACCDNGRNCYYGRDKNAGYFVCDSGYWGLGCSCVGHHLYYLAKCSVFAYTCCLTLYVARLVYGCCTYAAAGSFVRRYRLAGQGSFVYGTLSFKHYAVHWNAHSRPHHKDIAYLHLFDSDLDLNAIL